MTRAQALVLALASLHALLRFPPWSPLVPPSADLAVSLDFSWDWIFHEVWTRGLDCGREVVFTYGPWGFLMTGAYHPGTRAALLAVHVAASLVLVLSLGCALRRACRTPIGLLVALALAIESISLWEPGQTLFYHLAFALVLLRRCAPDPSPFERLLAHALAAALGLASLVKFTILVCAAVALGAVAIDEALARRRFPRIPWSYAASFAAAWLAAGQSPGGLPAYLASSIEIARGYNENMVVAGPASHVVLFALASLALLALASRASALRAPLPLAALAGLAFVTHKMAFVRHDAHALIASVGVVTWLAVLGALVRPWAGRAGTRVAGALAALLALLAADTITAGFAARHLPERIVQRARDLPREARAAALALAGRSRAGEERERVLAAVRRVFPLPPIAGTVDVVPVSQGLALAHGLDFRPRPVIQSYSAYTPELLRRNADHFAGPDAPENVLFSILTTDHRFPGLDDSLSWPVLMTRYDLRPPLAPATKHLWLARSPSPRAWRLVPLTSGRGGIGRGVSLPAPPPGAFLWVRLDVRPSAAGSAAALLYGLPPLSIALRLRSGARGSFRLAPGVARAGFPISPVIGNADDFRLFLSSQGAAALAKYEVLELAIAGEGGKDVGWAYANEFEVEISALEFERQTGL